jgi:hypothetical protein
MEFVPILQMAVLVFAIINFLKAVTNQQWSSAITHIVVWAAGVLVVFLAANTDFAEGISVGDQLLSQLNGWSLLFVGLTISSLAAFSNEVKQALDNHDSAAKPSLVPPMRSHTGSEAPKQVEDA